MFRLMIAATAVFLVGCTNNDPSLANNVHKKGDGIYEAMDVSDAVKQCQIEGNKKLHIITSTQEYSYVLKRYFPHYVFECNDRTKG